MNPQQEPQDNSPELEALLQTNVASDEKLGNIESNSDASLMKFDDIAANTEANIVATHNLKEPLEKIAKNTEKPSKTTFNIGSRKDGDDEEFNENEAGKALWEMLRGPKGKTPVRGEDYLTEEEIGEIKKEITPVKGKDYYTQSEIDGIKKEITPQKGIDYFDGVPGERGEPGRNPLTVSKRPPKNPQIGDLWYQN